MKFISSLIKVKLVYYFSKLVRVLIREAVGRVDLRPHFAALLFRLSWLGDLGLIISGDYGFEEILESV